MPTDSGDDSLFGGAEDWSDNDSLFGSCGKHKVDDFHDDALEAELATMLADDLDDSGSGPVGSSQPSTVSLPATQPLLPSMVQLSFAPSCENPSLLTLPGAIEAEALSPVIHHPAVPAHTPPVESGRTLTGFSLTLPSRPSTQSTPPSRTSTIPDLLSIALSCPDGHTSGCSVVSTQHLTHPSPTTSTQASEEEAELEALMELELLRDPDVNCTSPHLGDHEGLGLDPTLIPGNRYAHTYTRRHIPPPPRRIDLEEKVEILAPFLFFRKSPPPLLPA